MYYDYNYKKNKTTKIMLAIFAILAVIFILVIWIRSLPPKELISTKTYDIYKIDIDNDNTWIDFSYVDEDKKIHNESIDSFTLEGLVYLGQKDQVTVENFGSYGEISDTEIIKFHVTDETYLNLAKRFDW